ncbi:MAG: CvpA family protein [Eubacterium sp.]
MNLTTLDIICLVLIAGSAIIGYAKGAINTLINLAGFIASFVIAKLFSKTVTIWLLGLAPVKAFVENTLTQNITAAIATQSSEVIGFVNEVLKLDGLGALLSSGTAVDTAALSDAVMTATQPFIFQVTEFFVFIIILLLAGLVFGIVKHVGRGLNRVPVIGLVNRITGFGIGVIIGGAIACLIISAVLYYGIFSGNLSIIQMVKAGMISGPVSIYLY